MYLHTACRIQLTDGWTGPLPFALVLQRLADMGRVDEVGSVQVGDGAVGLEDEFRGHHT